MATHQDHMNIWENVVKGKYNSFSEITAAIDETGDEKLIADWENSSPETTKKSTALLKHNTDQYATAFHYGLLSLCVYDTNDNAFLGNNRSGTTAKDFWNEFRFNTGMTDTLSGKFTLSGTIKENGEIEWNTSSWLDPDKKKITTASLINSYKNQDSKSADPAEKYNQQIHSLQEKIKTVRSHLSELQKNNLILQDENIQKLIETDRKQIESYQQQIESIQLQNLEYQKQHLQH